MDSIEENNQKPNYLLFLKNILNLTFKIKNSYELKSLNPLGNGLYSIELYSFIKDISNYTSKKIVENFLYNKNENKCIRLNSSFIEENPNIYCTVSYQNDGLEVKFIKNNKNDKETNLEVWNGSILINSLKLGDYNISKVYYDDVFGKPKFSPDGKKVIFIGEFDYLKKFKNYFNIENKEGVDVDVQSNNSLNVKNDNEIVRNMSKFEYRQDFGELLPDKTDPQLFIYNIENNKVYHIKNDLINIFPGQPVIDKNDDIVFTGFNFPYFKFGLTYCLKRKSSLYLIKNPLLTDVSQNLNQDNSKNEKQNTIIELTENNNNTYTNIYPIFSPNFEHLLYFSNENATPHMNGLKLCSINWNIKNSYDKELGSKIKLDDYEKIKNYVKILIPKMDNQNDNFSGIYSYEDGVSLRNFLSEDLFIFNSHNKNNNKVYMYDIKRNRLLAIPSSNFSSSRIVSVHPDQGFIITLNSDINILPYTLLVKFNLAKYEQEENFIVEKLENGIDFVKYLNEEAIFETTVISNSASDLFKNNLNFNGEQKIYLNYLDTIIHNMITEYVFFNGSYGYVTYSKVIPDMIRDKKWKMPILYFLHGGPNATLNKTYLMLILIFVAHGYMVLVINYPGSTGFGQNYISSLSGKIGKLDVESCGDFLIKFIEKYNQIADANNIILFGGSHGGYIACWLMVHERYSKMFSSSVIRNPVTDLCSSMSTSDIPDWHLEQPTNENIDLNYPPSLDMLSKLYYSSPVYHAQHCTTPTLFLLGKVDKRINLSNGLYFYHTLVKNKCEAKALIYPEDSHPLSSPEAEIDCCFNICHWIESHLRH
jgi:dipeptidyl aminopeptidase/acylaminoacyl peptidase